MVEEGTENQILRRVDEYIGIKDETQMKNRKEDSNEEDVEKNQLKKILNSQNYYYCKKEIVIFVRRITEIQRKAYMK